ncbi:mitochondrial distribution and morphology family 33, partial [Cylindrobasidium torrendii FP15055 ss-10]
EFKSRLLKISDQAATQLRARTDDWTAITKTTFRRLGAELNTMTGYEEIDILKRKVVEQELRTNACRQASKDAKLRYEEAVAARSNSQREVNDLLQRKSSWSDADVSRFTVLIRQDHMLEQEETRAKIGVDEAEVSLEREFSELMRAILGRYHEEQIWSDKIRSAATYGQIAALALNLIVFILAIILVEPWKRKRLAQTFEKKTEELSAETKDVVEAGIADVKKELEVQVRALTVLAEAALKAEAERE